jgi:hypothetical protein
VSWVMGGFLLLWRLGRPKAWEVDCWHDWEQTGPPRLQLIRRTKLHLGAHHETGEDKVETIELVCFDQVNEGRWTLSFFPPMHTLER